MPDATRKTNPPLTLPLLVVLALAIRIGARLGLAVISRDGTALVTTAGDVAAGDLTAAWSGTQHPLYLLLAGLLGGTETAAAAVAIVFGALGVIPVFWIGRELLTRMAGVFAGLLYAVTPVMVRYQSAPYAESVFLPLALLATAGALAASRRKIPILAMIASGMAGGLAYLARPEGLLLLLLCGGLMLRRRFTAGVLFLVGFAALATPYVVWLSAEGDGLVLSPKKPVGRFVVAEEGFDLHMKEKSERSGLTRPGIFEAALETGRTLGEALDWILLPLVVIGAFALLTSGRERVATWMLLALLAADLALRFRLLHLHGYLGRRHLIFAAALCLPFAAIGAGIISRRRAMLVIGVLAAALLLVAVRPRDREKTSLAEAGRWILQEGGPGTTIATWRTPRIPYYASGTDLKLQRSLDVSEADWIALVPERTPEEVRTALVPVLSGRESRSFGEGVWRVLVYRLSR